MNRLLPAFAGIVVSLLTAGAAQAHPHVWATIRSEVVYAPDGSVIGIRHAWTFDEMYSAFAVQGLDHKEKGKFTSEELKPLAEVNVHSLKEYDYFTYAKADGRDAPFIDPVDYRLEFNPKDGVLTLHFLLPFKHAIKAKSLMIEVFDPEFFIDFEMNPHDPVALSGAPPGCQLHLDKPKEMTQALVQQLAAIPVDGKIPPNVYGEEFSNKISVRCP